MKGGEGRLVGALEMSSVGGGEVLGSEGGGCTGVLFGDAIIREHKELRGTALQRVLSRSHCSADGVCLISTSELQKRFTVVREWHGHSSQRNIASAAERFLKTD